jgi:hypothetical protein
MPRPAPPRVLVLPPTPPRLFVAEPGRDVDLVAPNFDDVREEVGKLETNEVSAVLTLISSDPPRILLD